MSERGLRILLAILAVLVAGWIIAEVVTRDRAEAPSEPLALASAAEASLDSVIVMSGTDTVRLRAAGDSWMVNGKEAERDAGTSLAEALESARIGQLVSRNPENHERLGVAADQGHQAGFYAGGAERLSIILGERAGNFDAGYVRRTGEAEVYELRGTLISLIRRDPDAWRNREILSVERENVTRVELAIRDSTRADTFALVRDSATWRLEPEGLEARSDAISSMLGQLAQLRAIGFAADSIVEELSWESPTARVTVYGPDPSAALAELWFLDREETGYFVRRADGSVVFTISQFTGDQVLPAREDLVAVDDEAEGSGPAEEEAESATQPG